MNHYSRKTSEAKKNKNLPERPRRLCHSVRIEVISGRVCQDLIDRRRRDRHARLEHSWSRRIGREETHIDWSGNVARSRVDVGCRQVDSWGHVADVIANAGGCEGQDNESGGCRVGGHGKLGLGTRVEDLSLGVTRFKEGKPCRDR